MPIEDFDGLKLHTQALGEPAHPVILLVHGMMTGSVSSWYFTLAPALAPDYRVLMYDLRGHGLSARAGTAWGVRAHAGDLARVVDRYAGGRPLTLVGHSAGGAIALRYALAHAHRVARLVMIDTRLPLFTRAEVDMVRGASVEALLELLPAAQRESIGRGGRQAQRLVAQTLALANETTLLDDMLAEPDFADAELGGLAVPMLLCYATHGLPEAILSGRRLAQRVPNARLTMLEGGHFLPLEATVALNRAIRDFHDA